MCKNQKDIFLFRINKTILLNNNPLNFSLTKVVEIKIFEKKINEKSLRKIVI